MDDGNRQTVGAGPVEGLPPAVSLREAVESDVEALAALVAEPGFDYPTELSAVHRRLTALMAAGDRILVAVCKSELIGMVLLHRTWFLHREPDGRISSLVVAESCRGLGVGALLMAEADTVFRRWGCGRVEVSSGPKRRGAHRFYSREGFLEQPKRFIKMLPDPIRVD